MFGMDWAYRGGEIRTIILALVWTFIIVTPFIITTEFLYFKPMKDRLAQDEADLKLRIQNELLSINNMNCQQLHNKLLSGDHFITSDNEAIARDHYVAQCGVRLP